MTWHAGNGEIVFRVATPLFAAATVLGALSSGIVTAVQGLDGPLGVGAGVTFLGFLGILFTLLVQSLTKVGNRADAINKQLTVGKDEEIARLERQIEAERKGAAARELSLREERDLWYRRWEARARPEQVPEGGDNG